MWRFNAIITAYVAALFFGLYAQSMGWGIEGKELIVGSALAITIAFVEATRK